MCDCYYAAPPRGRIKHCSLSVRPSVSPMLLLLYCRRRLRSSVTDTLVVPLTNRSTLGDRAFPVAASVRTATSLHPFRRQLKTFLYGQSFC